jgi:hypothetical protein
MRNPEITSRDPSTTPAYAGSARDDKHHVTFDLVVGLANDQSIWAIIRTRIFSMENSSGPTHL